jgi:hypothetical protein
MENKAKLPEKVGETMENKAKLPEKVGILRILAILCEVGR